MIKKILLIAAIVIPMCLSAQTLKFGTVNTQQIFELMPEKATAEKTLSEVSKKYEDEFKKLQDEFNKKYTEFQSLEKDTATPQSIKDRRIQELQEQQSKIQNFQQMASQDLQKQQETLLAPISEKIRQAVEAVGKENGFTMIFDLGNAMMSNILYTGAPTQDATALVKTKLGLKAVAAPAPAATK